MELFTLVIFSLGLLFILCLAIYSWFLNRETQRLLDKLDLFPPHILQLLLQMVIFSPLLTASILLIALIVLQNILPTFF